MLGSGWECALNEVGYFVIAILVALWLLTLSTGYDVIKRAAKRRDKEFAIRATLFVILFMISLWSIQSIFFASGPQSNIFSRTIHCSIK